jgi:uncharacterized protein YehS (DUF1456 family)
MLRRPNSWNIKLVDFRITKSELRFFSWWKHENYMECGDQVLRILNALVINLRGTKENPKN